MSKHPYPYDEDEFDDLAGEREVEGVHRIPTPWWRRVLPFVVVIIVAPLLAFALVQMWSHGTNDVTPEAAPTSQSTTESASPTGDAPSPDESASADDDADAGEDASKDAGADDDESASDDESAGEDESPSSDETDNEDSSADLNKSLGVWVLNGTGQSGLAGTTSSTLKNEGWTNVTAGNYSHQLPTTSAIFYTNSDMEAEAKAIGEKLGISALHEDASASSNGIVIVLRSDFRP